MFTFAQDLADILETVDRPGDFYAHGTHAFFLPRIEVDGVGPISLPLLPAQAEQLIAVAEQAPYGRGAETLVDTAVRRTWQIAADRIRLCGRQWEHDLGEIVRRTAVGLGVLEPVNAELYKMLVYDAGSFFVSHRDTEKAAGMFATLVVVLPSIFTGGELCIRHREREVCLDLTAQDPSELAFAGFYADCLHEVRPVTAGCRLVLIYNLIRPGDSELPQPPAYDTQVDRVAELLGRWAAQRSTGGDAACPQKLIWPLEHAYTLAEMRFSTLKLADAAVGSVLLAAAQRASCQVLLAFLTLAENGAAEYAYSPRSGRGAYYAADDGDLEAGEVFDRWLTLSDWQSADGSPSLLDTLPAADAELCPPHALDDADPDEEEFSEATGNAGASSERRYHRAAFVVWPKGSRVAIIAAAGRSTSLPCLERLTERWLAEGGAAASPLRHEARELARLMIARRGDWPSHGWVAARESDKTSVFLAALSRLEDLDNIAAYASEISATGAYAAGDNAALSDALLLLPPVRAAELLTQVIAGNAVPQASACADLLARLATSFVTRLPVGAAAELLRPAVLALLAALPGDAKTAAPAADPPTATRAAPLTPTLPVELLRSLGLLDEAALGARAVDHLLANPGAFSFDTLLIPAALTLAAENAALRSWAPTQRLISACLAYLAQRLAVVLAPPADFARDSRIDCKCRHCRELAAFLADPQRSEWRFKALQTDRLHVEESIRRHRCDVDTETVRRGSPHTLACQKNQASFERLAAQRERERQTYERLRQAASE